MLAAFVAGLMLDVFSFVRPMAKVSFNFDGHLKILRFVVAVVVEEKALIVQIIRAGWFVKFIFFEDVASFEEPLVVGRHPGV